MGAKIGRKPRDRFADAFQVGNVNIGFTPAVAARSRFETHPSAIQPIRFVRQMRLGGIEFCFQVLTKFRNGSIQLFLCDHAIFDQPLRINIQR